MTTGLPILFGGMALFATTVTILDAFGRRKQRRQHHPR
jgi:hypothetical protein